MRKDELAYIPRIRAYYQALGYGAPYVWAQFDEVPFAPLRKPLAEARIGLVTTAAPYLPERGDQGPGAAYNGAAKFFDVYSMSTETEPDLRISHIAYDRDHSRADDQASYFPLRALKALEAEGTLGQIAPRFHGLPTNRSQRKTLEVDCAELLTRCRDDGLDGVVLVPNCPVCHQSVSLAARTLEAAGIATVIMGAARDIVEHVGVPRLLFNNLPLGNAAGLPHDRDAQVLAARMAVEMLESAPKPRSTTRSPLVWSGDPDWQRAYSNADLLSAEEIARRRREFDKVKAEAKAVARG